MSDKIKIRKLEGRDYLVIKREEFKVGETRLDVEDWIDIFSLSDSVRILSISGTGAYYSFVPLSSSQKRLLCYNYCDDALKTRRSDFYQNALVLGCGGGAIPRWILSEYPSVSVDVVDYSPEIISICRKYFLKKWENSGRLKYYCTDARDYESPGYQYQFIFCDLFDGVSLSSVVYNIYFAIKLRRMICDNGILVINCGWGDIKMIQTVYKSVFEYVKVVNREAWQTQVIAASTSPFAL